MAFGEVKALYKYEFEPRDRAEVFGDDLIVYAYWIDNRFFCSASAWRVPKNMKWKDFVNHISSLYGLDPDYKSVKKWEWYHFDEKFNPQDDKTLVELGLRHKSIVKFKPA
jgi:hypothetical protein